MKTAEKILKEAYEIIEFVQDDSPEVIDPILLGMLHEYAEQFKPKWISVDDELPDEKVNVIIFNGTRLESTYIGYMMHGNWYMLITGDIKIEVTHWMTLPEKPQENG